MARSIRMLGLVVALVVVVAAASVPAATAYGCYQDCWVRCDNDNSKEAPDCTKMCNEMCGTKETGKPATPAGGTPP